MSFFTEVLILIVTVTLVNGAARINSVFPGVSGGHAPQCSLNTPCKWAVCEWRQTVRVDEECQFLHFPCQCGEGTTCQQTNIIKPGPSDYLTYYYYCLPPREDNRS